MVEQGVQGATLCGGQAVEWQGDSDLRSAVIADAVHDCGFRMEETCLRTLPEGIQRYVDCFGVAMALVEAIGMVGAGVREAAGLVPVDWVRLR